MLRDRTLWCLIAAAVGIVFFGAYKPTSPDPLENTKAEELAFFLRKTHGDEKHAGIILGDSRALRGISTDEMAEVLPRPRFFNFSFESGGMNDEMYDAVEARLAETEEPVVLLAITPLAFMPWKVGNAQYREYLAKPRDQVALHRLAPAVAEFFEPVAPVVFARRALNLGPKTNVTQTFHADGWIETDQTPFTGELEIERAHERLDGNRVSEPLVREFMARTRDWTNEGIRVFGLRPPAAPRMLAVEDSVLGFDQSAFAAEFEAAGGHWIADDPGLFETYDGSHLRSEEARRYSRLVAEDIRQVLEGG